VSATLIVEFQTPFFFVLHKKMGISANFLPRWCVYKIHGENGRDAGSAATVSLASMATTMMQSQRRWNTILAVGTRHADQPAQQYLAPFDG